MMFNKVKKINGNPIKITGIIFKIDLIWKDLFKIYSLLTIIKLIKINKRITKDVNEEADKNPKVIIK